METRVDQCSIRKAIGPTRRRRHGGEEVKRQSYATVEKEGFSSTSKGQRQESVLDQMVKVLIEKDQR